MEKTSGSSWWDVLLGTEILGMSFEQLGLSFLIILASVLLRSVVATWFFRLLKRVASYTSMEWDDRFLDALEKPTSIILLFCGIYFAIIVLPLDPEWNDVVHTLFRGGSILIIFWALFRVVDVFIDFLSDLSEKTGSGTLQGFVPLIKKSLKIFIAVVAVIMVLDNLGYNIGGIIATLGIGGAAFAFAAKDTIANIYGSIALALDRPFRVGDWIQVGDQVDGDVEDIGLRSTKVRTWPKTVISIPNAVLANEMIDNFARMPKRRVKQVVGVVYETKPETMEKIVEGIKEVLRNDEDVNQEFILVSWTDFGASSLDILVYYFTRSTKWLEYMEVRQRMNVKIAKVVAAHGSSIAFPTRTLHFDGEIARKMAGQRLTQEDCNPGSES